MAGQRREEAGKARAGAQAAADITHHGLPHAVVAHEGDAAVGAYGPGGRLADVVQQRAEAQRAQAGELVREGGLEQGGQARIELIQAALELDLALEDLHRVPVDVEMVVLALLHLVELGQLGEHRAHEPEAVGQSQPREHPVGEHQAAQLAEHPLARGPGHARSCLGRQPLGLRIGREAQLGGEAREPQRTKRVALVGLPPQHPQPPVGQVGPAAHRVDQLRRFPPAGPSRSP